MHITYINNHIFFTADSKGSIYRWTLEADNNNNNNKKSNFEILE